MIGGFSVCEVHFSFLILTLFTTWVSFRRFFGKRNWAQGLTPVSPSFLTIRVVSVLSGAGEVRGTFCSWSSLKKQHKFVLIMVGF